MSFRKVRFVDQALFLSSKFLGGFDLSGSCGGTLSFTSSVFHGSAVFRNAVFQEGARFEMVDFLEEASFADVKFCMGTSFARGRFRGRLRLWDVGFGEQKMAIDLGPVFRDCQFDEPVDFRSARFHGAFPEFSGAVLHAQTRFSSSADSWPHKTTQPPELARDSCSTIRHILAKQGLPEDEHFFFRKEMYFAGQIGSIWQRLPYLLFGLFSDYGHSIARPTFWLAGIWAFGFVAFWGYFSGCCVPAPLDVTERPMGTAMGLSFSNLFPLFGFGRTFLAAELAGLPAVLKTLAGFQTVFSLPLLFFLGLGLRQRFRLR
ncbi:pentapeptide repeat-containing protein [Pseudophaeobacter sp.]|uniref:pentapeptide repeat-containing protein n=1 Tax=Pseudophaeobacter sp. TaxID=1971739 RepID=UPI0032974D9A